MFRENQTINKGPLLFLDGKVFPQKVLILFFDSTGKEGSCSVCVYQLKTSKQVVKKVNSCQNAETKVRLMFFEVKMQEATCSSRN